jgi:aspartyl-tRNA synthetase
MFTEAPAKGHVVRVLTAPGAANRPRRWFDAFADAARQAGVTGSWLQIDANGDVRGSIAKKLTDDEIAQLVQAAGAAEGDAVLCGIGPRPAVAQVLGSQRSALGAELDLGDPKTLHFCWIVDFPMFEPDPETGDWAFSHNPFSMPQGGLEALSTKDPGDILAFQYDLVCNGVELSSGAVRNHLPEVMESAFAIAGYPAERVRESFPALWNAFHYGPPPHAGIAPGFDRILMLLEDQANLREIIAFPLNQGARDLLMGAPSQVSDKQLEELHLKVVPPKPS